MLKGGKGLDGMGRAKCQRKMQKRTKRIFYFVKD